MPLCFISTNGDRTNSLLMKRERDAHNWLQPFHIDIETAKKLHHVSVGVSLKSSMS